MARPIVVTVGPLAAASATQISLSQKSAAAGYLVLNGVGGSFSANSICQSQTPGGAGALTLNGALAKSTGYIIPQQYGMSGTIVASGTTAAYLAYPQRIYITGGSDESGKTFTVSGYVFPQNGNNQGPVAVTETITGPNASTVSSQNLYSIITSITVSAGTTGAITVGQYGSMSLDTARRVLVTSAGNDSGITFTVSGTDWDGNPIREVLTGANATSTYTASDFATITSIATSAAVATTVTVGTNGVASSRPVYLDPYAGAAQVAIQLTASGTVNYTLQQTLDDPNRTGNTAPMTYSAMTWVNCADTNAVAATGTVQTNYSMAPVYTRILLNSGTGTVTGTFTQAYLY